MSASPGPEYRRRAINAQTGVTTVLADRNDGITLPMTQCGTSGLAVDSHAVRDAGGTTTANLAHVSLKPESLADALLRRIDLATGVVTPIGAVDPNPSDDLLDVSIQPGHQGRQELRPLPESGSASLP